MLRESMRKAASERRSEVKARPELVGRVGKPAERRLVPIVKRLETAANWIAAPFLKLYDIIASKLGPLGDYVDFAGQLKPTWWAAPDYCCEPEIAGDRSEVLERVKRTAFKLDWCRQVAADRGVAPPMPVLQGWLPSDYLLCAEMMPELPALVGVGSVCRRSLSGEAGIIKVVTTLGRHLPPHVGLHLFGVKGSAIGALAGHPRIHSIDSAAWDFAARRERERNGVRSATVDYRSGYMRRWYLAQQNSLGLFARAA